MMYQGILGDGLRWADRRDVQNLTVDGHALCFRPVDYRADASPARPTPVLGEAAVPVGVGARQH